MAYTTPTLFFIHLTMDKKYTSILKFLDEIVKDIEKFREIDKKRWLPDQELLGWESMIDNLQEHIEEIRDFDPCPELDGEGGLIQGAEPVEWAQIDHEAERAFMKKMSAEHDLTNAIDKVHGGRNMADLSNPTAAKSPYERDEC